MVLVDDILRSGSKLAEMKTLLESRGATVVGLAVVIYQPTPNTRDFGNLPLYYLAKLDASYYTDAAHCELCKRGIAGGKGLGLINGSEMVTLIASRRSIEGCGCPIVFACRM